MSKKKADLEVAIIGAGFSGLGMAIKLQQAGLPSFAILEAADEVGGTWRDTRYPGAAVDVPNHLYSYSFEPSSEWTRMFAKSEEIQNYIMQVADKYNMRSKILFNKKVNGATFDEEQGYWLVKVEDGSTYTAHTVVSALGPFAGPSIPKLDGLKKFKGVTVHTSQWPDDLDLTGKNVVVVGSGASAIQVVPAIADKVNKLTVFQNRAPWVVPKADYVYSELERSIYRYLPIVQKLRRLAIYSITELLATAIVWDTPMTSLLENVSKNHREKAIQDAELRKKVTPNYRLGTTRMLISNDWYPALAKPNVTLVDSKAESLTSKGIMANGQEYQADVIIWATGYISPSQGFPFSIKGKDGKELSAYWKEGARGYKGVSIEGFPNLFTLMGPNTGPGHTSVLVYVEAQQDYILQAVQAIQKQQVKSLTIKPEKQNAFSKDLQEKMKRTTWGNGGESWYYTKDGQNTTLYPGFATEYIQSVANFQLEDYEVEKV